MIDFPSSPSLNQVFSAAGSSWTWDGVKWKALGSSVVDDSVNTITPVSGAIVALLDYRPVYVNNASTLLALTIRLPPSPAPDSHVEISFANPVTALAMQDSAGAAVLGGPTGAYGPGAALEFRYTTKWVYWK